MIYHETRPWGSFELFHENRPCTVKLIHVNPNSRLSLQYHKQRSEFWRVVKGTALVELDGERLALKEGEGITIPKLSRHRLGAGAEPCTIMEIAYGQFDENDIVRVEDDYRREAVATAESGLLAQARTTSAA